jgi:transposase
MGLNEIQKQTIAQRLRDGTSIRAIAAEVGVDKGTVLLTKQKVKPIHNLYLKSDIYTTQIFNF